MDGGGSADHVIRKLRQDVSARQLNPLCNALMEHKRFEVVCVTYTEEKANQIKSRLAKEVLGCSWQVYFNTNLLPLLDL